MDSKEFINLNKENMDVLGMWVEETKSSLIFQMESKYKREILKDMHISDIVFNGDKILIKWNKRYMPLSEEAVKEKYGE